MSVVADLCFGRGQLRRLDLGLLQLGRELRMLGLGIREWGIRISLEGEWRSWVGVGWAAKVGRERG